MSPVRRLRRPASRVRHPQTTVRWRLTLLYGGLFLASGAALLAITYTLVDNAAVFPQAPRWAFIDRSAGPVTAIFGRTIERPARPSTFHARAQASAGAKKVPPPIQRLLRTRDGQQALGEVVGTQRVADLHQLVIESAIALAIMALISTALGWVVAGRVLRPLRMMTTTTQEISEANLNRRLAMEGPPDELRQLADTIDGLLGRLEGAFDAQRRFVANASHELRTPLTAVRALLEMVLSDPRATIATFRATCEQVLEESGHQEELIEALLALAQSQRGIDRAENVDLASIAGEVLDAREGAAAARGLTLESVLTPVTIAGDARLIERLTSNLVDNAIRHNVSAGRIEVSVASAERPTLMVTNSGPIVPGDDVNRLLQPFQRLAPDRIGEGLGLGLSIVAAIAGAHDAELTVRARPEGGLEVEVTFPAAATPPPAQSATVPLSVQGGHSIGIR